MESVFSHSLHAMCNTWIRMAGKKTLASTQTLLFVGCVFVCFCVDIYENDIIFTSCIRFACLYEANETKQQQKQQYMRSKCSILFKLRLHTHMDNRMNSAIFTQYKCVLFIYFHFNFAFFLYYVI